MKERRPNGQFSKGNPGGPGRPSKATEDEYLAAVGDAVPLDIWKTICQRAAQDATKGNAKARDWLSKHLLPPPRDTSLGFDPATLYEEPVKMYAVRQK